MKESTREELADFLRFCRSERRLAAMTCAAYERDVRACLDYLQGEGIRDLAEVKVTHLRAFLAEEQKRRPAVSSQARTTAALKCFFCFLVEEERVLRDPALPLRTPKKREVLEFEFKLGETGNSGCALRAPLHGDPAFDGIELQMADFRYNKEAKDSELTGGLYRAIAPKKQVYRPTEWNKYHVTCKGSRIQVTLNGEQILDVDLEKEPVVVKRHDGKEAPLLKDRPRRGRIGFQELSRGSSVQIRNVRVKVLDSP